MYASDRKRVVRTTVYTTPTDLLTRLFGVKDCVCLMHYLHLQKDSPYKHNKGTNL